MGKAALFRRIGLGAAIALLAGPLAAQQLDPRVAMPLSQLIQLAGMQCQAGNPQACGAVQQLQQAGAALAQAQFACQQGDPQACHAFQAGAGQVIAAWQQMGGGQGGMAQGPGQAMFDHDQRMMQQRMLFQQHQDRMAQNRMMQDERHRAFMESLRR